MDNDGHLQMVKMYQLHYGLQVTWKTCPNISIHHDPYYQTHIIQCPTYSILVSLLKRKSSSIMYQDPVISPHPHYHLHLISPFFPPGQSVFLSQPTLVLTQRGAADLRKAATINKSSLWSILELDLPCQLSL